MFRLGQACIINNVTHPSTNSNRTEECYVLDRLHGLSRSPCLLPGPLNEAYMETAQWEYRTVPNATHKNYLNVNYNTS